MAIVFANNRGAYFPVPKVACTSIKEAIYKLEHGHSFPHEIVNGALVRHVHHFYRTHRFVHRPRNLGPTTIKCAVVRDPIERLLSAYANRVVDFRELSESAVGADILRKASLKPDPDADFFFAHVREYMRVSESIEHHFALMTVFLGDDATYFDRIFRIDELSDFEAFVSTLAQRKVNFPHEQRSLTKIDFKSLTAKAQQAIRDYVRPEYGFLQKYYAMQK